MRTVLVDLGEAGRASGGERSKAFIPEWLRSSLSHLERRGEVFWLSASNRIGEAQAKRLWERLYETAEPRFDANRRLGQVIVLMPMRNRGRIRDRARVETIRANWQQAIRPLLESDKFHHCLEENFRVVFLSWGDPLGKAVRHFEIEGFHQAGDLIQEPEPEPVDMELAAAIEPIINRLDALKDPESLSLAGQQPPGRGRDSSAKAIWDEIASAFERAGHRFDRQAIDAYRERETREHPQTPGALVRKWICHAFGFPGLEKEWNDWCEKLPARPPDQSRFDVRIAHLATRPTARSGERPESFRLAIHRARFLLQLLRATSVDEPLGSRQEIFSGKDAGKISLGVYESLDMASGPVDLAPLHRHVARLRSVGEKLEKALKSRVEKAGPALLTLKPRKVEATATDPDKWSEVGNSPESPDEPAEIVRAMQETVEAYEHSIKRAALDHGNALLLEATRQAGEKIDQLYKELQSADRMDKLELIQRQLQDELDAETAKLLDQKPEAHPPRPDRFFWQTLRNRLKRVIAGRLETQPALLAGGFAVLAMAAAYLPGAIASGPDRLLDASITVGTTLMVTALVALSTHLELRKRRRERLTELRTAGWKTARAYLEPLHDEARKRTTALGQLTGLSLALRSLDECIRELQEAGNRVRVYRETAERFIEALEEDGYRQVAQASLDEEIPDTDIEDMLSRPSRPLFSWDCVRLDVASAPQGASA